MSTVEISAAGQERLRDLNHLAALQQGKTSQENSSLGATIVKILAIITSLFLTFVVATAPNPAIAFVAIPIILLTCVITIKYAEAVASCFANLKCRTIFIRRNTGTVYRPVHHYHSPPSRAKRYAPGHTMGHTSYQPPPPSARTVVIPAHPPRKAKDYSHTTHSSPSGFIPGRKASDFRQTPPPAPSMLPLRTPPPQNPPVNLASGTTFGPGKQKHASVGGRNGRSDLTRDANGQLHVAVGSRRKKQ